MQGDVRVMNELVREESAFLEPLMGELEKVIVGQTHMIERLLVGLLTGGHVLLEGVPGLAKTLTINTVASAISAKFQRIQFTPDLLPADLIGTMIYHQETGEFTVKNPGLTLRSRPGIGPAPGHGGTCLPFCRR